MAADASAHVAAPKPDAAARAAVRGAASTYLKALADGRSATRARKYADARAAFDRALAAQPDDARALGERGYARLLAGDLDGADADLNRALAIGNLDRDLGASVQFNRGLVLEKRHRPDDALAAFVLANAEQTSPARLAKLGGKSGCTAEVRTGAGAGPQVTDYADWAALEKAVGPDVDRHDAKKSVCIREGVDPEILAADNVCDEPWPWTLLHNYGMYTWTEWIVWPHDGRLSAIDVGTTGHWPAQCFFVPQVDASADAGLVHLHTVFDGTDGELDESAPPSADGAQMTCRDVVSWTEDRWIDTRSEKTLLSVRTYAASPAPKITVSATSIVLEGAGCDQTVTR